MTKRKTALDKAIEKLDGEIAILQHARAKLVEQQTTATPKPIDAAEPAQS